MTAIQLFRGVRKFTNAALATATREVLVLYSVPAGRETLLTEGFWTLEGAVNLIVNLYILESGGTDFPGGLLSSDTQRVFDDDLGVPIILEEGVIGGVPAGQPPYSNEITRAHIMASGDSLRMNVLNATGGPADVTGLGIVGLISGLEFG